MKKIENIGLKDVQAVYGGPEGRLWGLVMGEQIHIGGFVSSMDLAEQAGIGAGKIAQGLFVAHKKQQRIWLDQFALFLR